MKVLTIFIDMIRANRLSTFNDDIKVDTPLDIAFKELGGTVYSNCYTQGPDTPRGISSYYTGLEPYKNGCNVRLKWPQYFLKKDLKTVFDLFLEKEYSLDIFSSTNEKKNGFLPEDISSMDIHNKDNDLSKYLDNLELKDKHFVFLSLPDYHWAFDDYGYSKNGEKFAYDDVKDSYDIIFDKFDKDEFDHIFVFSDHGFKFSADFKLDDDLLILDDDRTNSIMLHREKKVNVLTKNTKLCALTDMYATYQDLLGETPTGISLFDKKEHPFLVIEDHLSFAPQINQNIEVWAVVTNEILYIRKLDKILCIDKHTKVSSKKAIAEYDKILVDHSTFSKYMEEYEKIFLYKENIILDKSSFMSGKKRKERAGIIKRYYIIVDIIRKILKKGYLT